MSSCKLSSPSRVSTPWEMPHHEHTVPISSAGLRPRKTREETDRNEESPTRKGGHLVPARRSPDHLLFPVRPSSDASCAAAEEARPRSQLPSRLVPTIWRLREAATAAPPPHPAGSGLVAFAGALGFMPLDMPESVLVRFMGQLNPGITLRDVVNAIPYWAIQQGLLTVPKKNKKNIFNGRILEMEGLPNLSVEQAFELTDATAERSAAAGCIKLSEETVATYLRSNVALMRKMIADGYQDPQTLQKRIEDVEAWLAAPKLLEADANAEYAAVIEIDLAQLTEPILACPNDPDDVKLLSDVANTPINDVFLGSCMTNIGHYRAAGEIWRGQPFNSAVRTWIAPPPAWTRPSSRTRRSTRSSAPSAPASRSLGARCAWATKPASRTAPRSSRPRRATSMTAWAQAPRSILARPSWAP